MFCAEEIKADAIVCRFCGALKENGEWKPPQPRSGAAVDSACKGRFNIRTAGVLFVASAIFELISVTTEIPLFGAVRGGAVLYHLVYATLFLAMGVGLLMGRRWGYRVVLAGTLYYTLDKSLYLLDRKTMEVHLMQQLQQYREIFELIEKDSILQMMVLTTVLFVGCWRVSRCTFTCAGDISDLDGSRCAAWPVSIAMRCKRGYLGAQELRALWRE
jgi:hypothetical protein